MEIEQLRKEINELLENVVEHSNNYSGNRQIPSLEISFVLSKINKMQEALIILKHLLNEQELELKRQKKIAPKEILIEKKEEYTEPTIVVQEQKIEESILPKKEVVENQNHEIPPKTKAIEISTITEKPKAKKDIEKLPISKIVDAFSLNDRYLYANELFDKNMSAFNELVKSIDNCTSYQEAEQLLTNTKNELDWDTDYIHVLSFYSLVERRFL